MRVIGLACLVVAAIAGDLAGTLLLAGAQEGGLRLTGRIAFVSDEDGNPGDIYVMDATGTDRVRLTNDGAYDGHPSWSPDGEEIVFWSRRAHDAGDIYTMQANGQGVMRLTRHAACDSLPAWSPDGTRIAFVSTRDSNPGDIYVMNTDGTEPMRLTDDPLLDTQPCWSPDGSQIAFARVLEGVSSSIHVVPSAGGTPAELVTADGWAAEPTWCPARDELAFVLATGMSNWGDVWFADALDGTVLSKWRYQGVERRPTWLRDGSMVCCSHSRRPNGAQADLVILDLGSGNTIQLTNSESRETEPDWWAPTATPVEEESAPTE